MRRSTSVSSGTSDCTSDEIEARGLLTSCATPLAKVPAAARRSALSSESSISWRWRDVVQDHLQELTLAGGDERGIDVEITAAQFEVDAPGRSRGAAPSRYAGTRAAAARWGTRSGRRWPTSGMSRSEGIRSMQLEGGGIDAEDLERYGSISYIGSGAWSMELRYFSSEARRAFSRDSM